MCATYACLHGMRLAFSELVKFPSCKKTKSECKKKHVQDLRKGSHTRKQSTSSAPCVSLRGEGRHRTAAGDAISTAMAATRLCCFAGTAGERSEKSIDSTRQVFPRVAGPFRVFPQRWGPGTRRRSEENYHLGLLKTLFPSGFGRRRSKRSLNPKRNLPDAQPRHVYKRAWNRPKRLVQLR